MHRAHLQFYGTVYEDIELAKMNWIHFHMTKPEIILNVRKLVTYPKTLCNQKQNYVKLKNTNILTEQQINLIH